jgi:hypothetical protein
LDIGLSNATVPSDWKETVMVPINKRANRSLVSNYRSVSLISAVSKQIEHVITSYLREICEKKDWIFEGQHGFSCKSQVITACQDIADYLDNVVRTDAIIIDFSKAFDLVPHDRLLRKLAASGVDLRVVVWIREFLLGRIQRE